MIDNKIRLSDASRKLGVEYNTLFRAVISGKVPAERNDTGNRWLIKTQDLPGIAKTLGLLPEGARRPSPTVHAHRR